MKKFLSNLDALLITNPTNIRYLTGFVGAAPEEREGYVLLTKSQTFLFTNALYREDAKRLIQNPSSFKRLNLLGSRDSKGLTFVEISREEPFAKKLATILMSVIPGPTRNPSYLKTGSRPASPERTRGELKGRDDMYGIKLGFEETDLTVAEFGKLKDELGGVQLIPTKNRIEELRMIKRGDEIENIRAAATITDQCFDFILQKIKPGLPAEASAKVGVTESEIAWAIESFIRGRGAQLAFSPIVAFGAHTSQPHYTSIRHRLASSQDDVLQTQNIILLDFGAKVNGYCSDMTRVVFVGKPKEEWVKAYETVLTAQQSVLDFMTGLNPVMEQGSTLKKNYSGSELDRIAREIIKKAGFPTYPHSLGHGVGLDIHEAPRLRANPSTGSKKAVTSDSVETLRAGMIVTVEPGVYIEGQYGIRLEDLILLKEDGIEVLSKSDKQVIIL
ncbi:aminopeptidase P family protein [Candidatus Gottesmanbacteria bacterium]|nr:aminopeptidase P family protein [Candidatus Gottesmanbacteria bacterium]